MQKQLLTALSGLIFWGLNAQTSQGFEVGPFEQSRAFDMILAVLVLPLPLRPEKRYAWDNLFESRAKDKVWEIVLCPIRSSNLLGLYFSAST